jgi:hypothetical protein
MALILMTQARRPPPTVGADSQQTQKLPHPAGAVPEEPLKLRLLPDWRLRLKVI